MFSDLRLRLRALFARAAMERELDAELRFHLEHETEKLVRAGLSRRDAERQARIALGGVERTKEDTRDARGIALFDTLSQDLSYAWRGLRSKPGFAIAVVTTLGLGVGANAVMFGIVDRMLFRPPAYMAAPERTHRLYVHYVWDGRPRFERNFEYTRYLDFQRYATTLDVIAAIADREVAVGVGDDARVMNVSAISANTFTLFDARPALGRFFNPGEDRTPGGAPVAVLGYGFWQSRYGGRNDVLGQTLHIDQAIYTIIGIAPESFVGITEERAPAAFIPITTFAATRNDAYYRTYNWSWLEIVARRKPGVTTAQADADISNAYVRSWGDEMKLGELKVPATSARARALVAPLQLGRGPEVGPDAKIVVWVMGVAVIVLLIACANVANLLLARSVQRRREIALRLALGVTRPRLLQQLLTESALIAAIGGVAGLAAAQWGGSAIRAFFLHQDEAGVVVRDGRTLFFGAAITIVVALLTGIAPTLQALRGDMSGALKAGAREGTYRASRLRTGLLVFQGALSVLLLVGAGLFVRSLANVRAMRLGYDTASLVYIEGNPRGAGLSPAATEELSTRLLASTVAAPGVRTASLTISVPFWSSEGRGAPIVAGRDSLQKLGRFVLQSGSPSYFATTGTRILRGRAFNADDGPRTVPVAVISESMAKAIWPDEDAIGKRFRVGGDTKPDLTVIGIAENMRQRSLTGAAEFMYYIPIAQYSSFLGSASPQIFARVDGRAEDFLEPLRRRLQPEMPGIGYVTAVPLRQLVAPRQRSWEFGATMFVAFGALAMVLAAIGLYSVIAYAVAQRTHELGVRIALGAGVSDIVRMVVGQGIAFAVTGVVLGSAIALAAGRWIQPLLFSQSARDPSVFGVVAAVLLASALAATLRPAFRATRVNPTEALRAD